MDVSGPTNPRSGALNERGAESPRRFRIQRCLGRGSFGEVYRATMSRDGGVTTEIAVKILAADLDPSSDAVVRLRDEGRLLGALSHPAIVHVYDLVLLAGRVALVTEYVEGQDLHNVMFGPGAMPFRALVEAIGQVGEALHAAWTTESPYGGGPMHLVHRDVKPQNIRIGVHGQVKLLDFGIARAANVQREANTQTNLLLGSWPYLAPERLRDEERLPNPAIDVYSLGCTLYEGLTGERLMEGRKLLDLYRYVDEPGGFTQIIAERLPKARKKAPAPVYALLEDLLREDATARPSPQEVAQRCEDLAEALPGIGIRRWAREREWPTTAETDGPLTEYELTEGNPEVPPARALPIAGTPVPSVRTIDPGEQAPVSAIAPPPPPLFRPTPQGAPPRQAPAASRSSVARTVPAGGSQEGRSPGPAAARQAPAPRAAPAATPAATPRGTAPRQAPAPPVPVRPGPTDDGTPTPVVRKTPPPEKRTTPLPAAPRNTPAPAPRATPAAPVRASAVAAEAPTTLRSSGATPKAPAPAPPPQKRASEDPTQLMKLPKAGRDEPAVDLLNIRIDEPNGDAPRPEEPSGASPVVKVGVGVAVAGLVVAGMVVVLVAFGAWWFLPRGGDVAVAPLPTPVPAAAEPVEPAVEPSPAGVEPAGVEPEPQPDPRPASPDPRPASPDPRPGSPDPRPGSPDPRPGAPKPAPAQPAPAQPAPAEPEPAQPEPGEPEPAQPEPAEPEPAEPEPGEPEPPSGFGTLSVTGGVTVELQGEFGGFRPGTPLPPGTYQVYADFGDGMVDTGKGVEAGPGSAVRVACDGAARTCTVSP